MTYTHLRVGTKPFRSKPPRKGAPCSEPYVTGANILRDPGFELSASNPGWVGPDNDFPDDYPGRFNDGVPQTLVAYPNGFAWMTDENENTANNYWGLSTASPRTGTYHARLNLTGVVGNPSAGSLWACMFVSCPLSSGNGWSARVEPGDFVKHDAYIKGTTSSGTLICEFVWDVYDASNSWVAGDVVSKANITASYTLYSSSFVVPATGHYVLLGYACYPSTYPVTGAIDVDDAVLEVGT